MTKLPTILNCSDIESKFPDIYELMGDDEMHQQIEASTR
ncbi:MAG TPA: histidine kinase, partial [Cyanobacteria bacterium UBA8543]|nr:histidine kinase [Cyanobacteria bacterium UBA8543]